MAVNYVKWALFLLKNCSAVPTDTMGLLNDVMTSADCVEFTEYRMSMYFTLKLNRLMGSFMDYLDTAKAEYCTLYCNGKWSKADSTPVSAFTGDTNRDNGYQGQFGGRGHGNCNGGRGGRGCGGQN